MTLKDTIKCGAGIGIFAFAALSAFAIDVKIDTSKTRQTIDNFAAADAWSGYFVGQYFDESQKGQIAISIGDFKLAEECYAKVVSVPDPSVFSRRIYAAVLERNGKFAQAKGILEKILGETEKDSPLVPILKKQIGTLQNLIEKTSAKKADE